MMNRLKFILIVALCALIGRATAVAAEKIKIGEATYEVKDGAARLSDYKKAQGDVVIPSEITDKKGNVYPVTAIGKNAFKNSEIVSIVLPASVTSLGQSCFESAKKLSSVQFTDHKISYIPEKAFADCPALESFSFEGVEKIGFKAFTMTGLKNLVIPENVKEIYGSFMGCTDISSITFEDSDSTILIREFPFYLTQVKKLYLGRNFDYKVSDFYAKYTEYGHPFNNNTYLETVEFGPKVTDVKDRVFFNCTNLSSMISTSDFAYTLLDKHYSHTKLSHITIPRNGQIPIPTSPGEVRKCKNEIYNHIARCNIADGIEEFKKTRSIDKVYSQYINAIHHSNWEMVKLAFETYVNILDTVPAQERASIKWADERTLMNLFNNCNRSDYSNALKIIRMAIETYNTVYAISWEPVILTRMGRDIDFHYYEEAAKKYPKAVEIVTERGRYDIPEELSHSGLELRRLLPAEKTKDILVTQKAVQAKYEKSSKSKKHSSSGSGIGVADVFDAVGSAYKAHKQKKAEDDLIKTVRKNNKKIKKMLRDK